MAPLWRTRSRLNAMTTGQKLSLMRKGVWPGAHRAVAGGLGARRPGGSALARPPVRGLSPGRWCPRRLRPPTAAGLLPRALAGGRAALHRPAEGGAARQFVLAPASCQRLPALAWMAGAILMESAAPSPLSPQVAGIVRRS